MTMRDRWDRLKKTVEENEALKKTKSHFSRHKGIYITGAIGVATGVIIGRHTARTILQEATNSPMNSTVMDSYNTTINATTNHYGTPLSYMVGVDGDDLPRWLSQADAGRSLGETPVNISRHLQHGADLPNNPGMRLMRFGIRDRNSQN